jgi:hypothetical protein
MDQQTSGMETGFDQASAEYVGRWNRLVSTTNWEKGRIICQWRERLEQEGMPASSATDEAWSLAVGNVSPQHVGRLRRVYQRFGSVAESYAGLFWSHFQAALDWDDAEMWLEGAVQSRWSVSQMRRQRWQANGGAADAEPLDEALPATEFDEDSEPPVEDQSGAPNAVGDAHEAAVAEQPHEADVEPAAAWDEGSADATDETDDPIADDGGEPASRPVRPFENLPPLPKDLTDVVEQFKLALLKHKVAGWQEVRCDDVLATLDALKQLATAP